MLQIRRNCFETNSSSTHSLVLCEDDDYEALLNNEAFLSGSMYYDPVVVRKEYLLDNLNEEREKSVRDNWKKYCKETGLNPESVDDFANEIIAGFDKADTDLMFDFYTLDQMWDNSELETFDDTYKTKDGKIIHAFGCHGYLG